MYTNYSKVAYKIHQNQSDTPAYVEPPLVPSESDQRERELEDGSCKSVLCSFHEMKEVILKLDKDMMIARCSQDDKAPVVAEIARAVGWEKLWDASLDEGPRCIQRLKRLVKCVCHRCFNDDCDRFWDFRFVEGHVSSSTVY